MRLMAMLSFFYALLGSLIHLSVPLCALDMGVSPGFLGILLASFVAAGAFLSFPCATLTEWLGCRKVTTIAYGSYAAGAVLYLLARTPARLAWGMILAGVGDVLFTVGGLTLLTEVLPAGRENVGSSVVFSVTAIGGVLGASVGGVAADRLGFRFVFFLILATSLLAASLSLRLPSVMTGSAGKTSVLAAFLRSYQMGYNVLHRNKTMRTVTIINALGTIGWSTFRSSFYLDYLHRLGWSSGTIGLVVAMGSGARVLAASIYLLVSSLIGVFSALAFGLGFAGLGLGLTPFLTTVPVIALVGCLSQATDGFRQPGVLSLIKQGTQVQDRATSVALNNTSWALATFVGGLLWAAVAEIFGLTTAFIGAGLAIVLGVSGIYIWNRHQVSSAQHEPREGKVV